MIRIAEYIFAAGIYDLETARFDVQTFGDCPVVASLPLPDAPAGSRKTWSVYRAFPELGVYAATREENDVPSIETFFESEIGAVPEGVVTLPMELDPAAARWAAKRSGQAVFVDADEAVTGDFVCRNAVWLDDDGLLRWLQEYTEHYPGEDPVTYLRLGMFERGVGLKRYLDLRFGADQGVQFIKRRNQNNAEQS